jgi:hypothetical protein
MPSLQRQLAIIYQNIFEIIGNTGLSNAEFLQAAITGKRQWMGAPVDDKGNRIEGAHAKFGYAEEFVSSASNPAVENIVLEIMKLTDHAFGYNGLKELPASIPEGNPLFLHFDCFFGNLFGDPNIDTAFVIKNAPRIAATYGGVSVFTTRQIKLYVDRDPVQFDYVISRNFFDLLFALKPLLIRGHAAVIPRRFKEEDENMPSTSYFTNRITKHLDLDVPTVCDKHIEIPQKVETDQLLRFHLPVLRNLSIDDVVKFREDFSEEHTKFQSALKRLVTLKGNSDSDQTLKAVASELEFQRNKIQEKYDNETKTLQRKGVEIAVGSAVTVLSLALPSEVGQYIRSLFAGKTVADGIAFLKSRDRLHSELQKSEFWWPWMLRKQGEGI